MPQQLTSPEPAMLPALTCPSTLQFGSLLNWRCAPEIQPHVARKFDTLP
jgi:hypothetical protein